MKPMEVDKPDTVNGQTLSMKTVLHETEMDVLAVRHEVENDLQMILTNQALHEQSIQLRRKNALALMDFEESRSRLLKSQFKAEEAKAKLAEYEAQVELTKLKVAQTQGMSVKVVTLARIYAKIWESRVEKVLAAKKRGPGQF